MAGASNTYWSEFIGEAIQEGIMKAPQQKTEKAGQVGVACEGGLQTPQREVQIRLPDTFMHILGRVKELNPGLDVGSDSCYDNTGDWVLIVRSRE